MPALRSCAAGVVCNDMPDGSLALIGTLLLSALALGAIIWFGVRRFKR